MTAIATIALKIANCWLTLPSICALELGRRRAASRLGYSRSTIAPTRRSMARTVLGTARLDHDLRVGGRPVDVPHGAQRHLDGRSLEGRPSSSSTAATRARRVPEPPSQRQASHRRARGRRGRSCRLTISPPAAIPRQRLGRASRRSRATGRRARTPAGRARRRAPARCPRGCQAGRGTCFAPAWRRPRSGIAAIRRRTAVGMVWPPPFSSAWPIGCTVRSRARRASISILDRAEKTRGQSPR